MWFSLSEVWLRVASVLVYAVSSVLQFLGRIKGKTRGVYGYCLLTFARKGFCCRWFFLSLRSKTPLNILSFLMSRLQARIAIVMGSKSDWPVMQAAAEVLEELGLPYERDIVSAHRTPEYMMDYARRAHERGLAVIIAGAGGAAHLPGMVASLTPLPVIGVPVKSSNSLDGWDSILSILQMPGGVPVATVALNGARNAGLLAARILGAQDQEVLAKIMAYQQAMRDSVLKDKW